MQSEAPPLTLPRCPRYRSLDMWRGLACLLVVMYHSSVYAEMDGPNTELPTDPLGKTLWFVVHRGGIGVPMFFVISGYCIAATADSCRRKSNAFRRYVTRRIRRIYPPYWAVLASTVLTVLVVTALAGPSLLSDDFHPIPQPATLSASQWFGNLTLTESIRPYFFGGPTSWQLGPAGTLGYEEQFYLVCGLLLLCCPRRFFLGIMGVSALTMVLVLLHWVPQGFFFDGLWLQFAAGVAVYYWVNYSSRLGSYLLPGFLALLVAACLVLRPIGGWEFKLFVIGGIYALILMGLHRFDGALARSALLKPIDFCGKMCYSMYLVHWPIVKLISNVLYVRGVRSVWETLLITVPLATSVSILAACIFYWLVERHFLNTPSALASQRQTSVNIEETKQKSPVGVVSAEVETNGGCAIPEIVPAPGSETLDQSELVESSVGHL